MQGQRGGHVADRQAHPGPQHPVGVPQGQHPLHEADVPRVQQVLPEDGHVQAGLRVHRREQVQGGELKGQELHPQQAGRPPQEAGRAY